MADNVKIKPINFLDEDGDLVDLQEQLDAVAAERREKEARISDLEAQVAALTARVQALENPRVWEKIKAAFGPNIRAFTSDSPAQNYPLNSDDPGEKP